MTSDFTVGVLICTRDRPESLTRALDALRVCTVPANMTLEAVIVDNNSAGDIAPLVSDFGNSWTFPVTLIRETRPGLAAARNAGVTLLASDWIVMTDDDCLVAPDYFVALERLVAQDDDRIRMIGGRVLLDDDTDLPITIRDDAHSSRLSRGDHPAGFLQGCNMCVSRDVIKLVGKFDNRFGAGAAFRSAEDTDYIYRAAKAGIDVTYQPSLLVYHAHGRKSLIEAATLFCSYQYGNAAFCMKLVMRGDVNGLRYLRWDLKDIFFKREHAFERGIPKRRRLAAMMKGIWHYLAGPPESVDVGSGTLRSSLFRTRARG